MIPCDNADTAARSLDEPRSFDVFFRDQYPATVRLAHLLTHSNAIAEELAQDAFARVYPRFAELREPAAYLRRTTVNVCRNWYRYRRRELDRFRRHGPTGDSVEDSSTGSTEEMIELIGALPYRQRAVLVMRYWQDLTEADIADALGCRPGTVKSLHSRAIAAIRKELP